MDVWKWVFTQFDFPVQRQKNVSSFQISVDDLVLVKVDQRLQGLTAHDSNLRLGQWPFQFWGGKSRKFIEKNKTKYDLISLVAMELILTDVGPIDRKCVCWQICKQHLLRSAWFQWTWVQIGTIPFIYIYKHFRHNLGKNLIRGESRMKDTNWIHWNTESR